MIFFRHGELEFFGHVPILSDLTISKNAVFRHVELDFFVVSFLLAYCLFRNQ